MIRYIFKRILLLIPILIAVSFVVYFIVDLAPGDSVDVIYAGELSQADMDALRAEMGLDDPLLVRYFRYMKGMVRGDMGLSSDTGQPVFDMYMARLPNTLLLALSGIAVAFAIAVPLGILAAVRQNTWIDAGSSVLGLLGLSMPNFWLGLLLIIAFSLKLGWFPSYGNVGLVSLVLPAITVGTGQAALIMRTTRSSMLEVIRQDYIRTARAKGVSKKMVVRKHALKNALIPIITVMGTQLGSTLGGAVLTETVFAWNGVGRLIVNSVYARDINTATGAIILTTMLASIMILAVDIVYAFVDPRIKARYAR